MKNKKHMKFNQKNMVTDYDFMFHPWKWLTENLEDLGASNPMPKWIEWLAVDDGGLVIAYYRSIHDELVKIETVDDDDFDVRFHVNIVSTMN